MYLHTSTSTSTSTCIEVLTYCIYLEFGGAGGVIVESTEESINDQSGMELDLFFMSREGAMMESRLFISAMLGDAILGLSRPTSVALSTLEIGPGIWRL